MSVLLPQFPYMQSGLPHENPLEITHVGHKEQVPRAQQVTGKMLASDLMAILQPRKEGEEGSGSQQL